MKGFRWVMVAAMVLASGITSAADFRSLSWGDSKKDVIKAEGDPASTKGDVLFFMTEVAGRKAVMMTNFMNGALHEGTYIFQAKHTNKNKYIDDFKSLNALLTKKYGDPSRDEQVWKRHRVNNDMQHAGIEVATGGLVFVTEWVNGNTKIVHAMSGGNYQITHMLLYQDASKIEEARQKKEEAAIDDL